MSGSVPNPNLLPEGAESNLKMHPSTPAATTEKSRTAEMRGTEEGIAPPPSSSQKKKKPKRKRYMPKVIREGKPKPKPKTPKAPKTPANTAEATPAKRKHVRRRKQEGGGRNAKGDPLQPSSHVHAEIVEKAEKVVNLRIVKRLNFDHQEPLPTADKHGSGIAKSEATPAKGKHGLEDKQEEEGDGKRDPLQPPSHLHAEKVAQAEKVVDLNTLRHLNFDPKGPRLTTDGHDSGIVDSEAASASRKHMHEKKQEEEVDAKRDSLQPVDDAEKADKIEKVVNLNIVERLNFDPKEPPLTPDKHDTGIVETETFSAEILKIHMRRQTQLLEQLKTYVRRNKMKKEVESHECSTSNSERPLPVKITGEKRRREEDNLWPFEIPKGKRTRRRDKRMIKELSLWPFEIPKGKRMQNAKRSSIVVKKKGQFPHVEPVETHSPSSCIENPVSGESSSIDVPTSSIQAIDGPLPRTQCMDAMKEPRRCGSSKSTGLKGPLARLECFNATEEPRRHESPKRVLELDGPLARIECLNATEDPRRSEGLNRIVGHDGPLARIECLNTTEETTRCERPRRMVGHDKQEKSAPKRHGRSKKKEIVEKIPKRRYTRRRTVPFQEFQHSGDCNDLDAIVRKMMHLSIGDGRELVPYVGGCGAMVPFEDPTGIFTKRKRRAMVDLDPVSIRMWDLLMGSKTSEGDEEEEIEINLKFNQERDALCQRVHLFISCMSRFLGKRTFSPWKGSVVDSVIGVFLTQNVSDYLSSTAFMLLAAAFPAEPKGNHETANAETSSRPIPSDTNSVSQERMAEQEFSCQTSVSINEVEQMDDNEMTNYNGSPQSNSRSDSVDNLRISSMHFTEKGLAIRSPDCLSDNAVIDDEDRPLEDVACSPNSVVSNQGSSVTVGQATENVPSDPVVASQDSVASSQENSFCVDQLIHSDKSLMLMNSAAHTSQKASVGIGKYKSKSKRAKIDAQNYDWESLRKQICQNGAEKERSSDSMDALDYDALRDAEFEKISNIIKIRGQYISLTSRIKDFLNRLVKDHGNMDLEWLRDAPPDKAKDYLLSIDGLGLKSVECVRLLSLRQQAFPVDVNVGRICVRLGWVPLQPLPESLQLHLLDMYPVLATVQKYLWPRICKLDHSTLYELHYLLITFGKVYCTKTRPNCNACPMRGDCKHYASAYASSRLALPPPEDKSLSRYEVPIDLERSHTPVSNMMQLQQPETSIFKQNQTAHQYWEPIIEEPESPEHENMELKEYDIEDFFSDDPEEYSAVPFKWEEFTQNLQSYMHENMELEDISKALITITSEAASFPLPKLKSVERLRTEHQAYVLPDSHPLLRGLAKRERADQGRYLLTIWSPGETVQSTETPQVCCNPQGTGNLCDKPMCFSCNRIREERAQIVRGTLMIPCRTANRGRFPLNGTYFQLQEVFADHHSSYNPIPVPRYLLDNLPMRTVYFGSSLASIAKDLPNERIQKLFDDDYICVRAFDQETRLPKTLCPRLHNSVKQPTKKK